MFEETEEGGTWFEILSLESVFNVNLCFDEKTFDLTELALLVLSE